MRALDSAFLDALAKPCISLALFAWLDWPGQAVRAHTRTGTITWGGQDWLGVGEFGSIAPATEGGSGIAKRLTLSLVGFREKLDGDLGAVIRNRAARIYWGLLGDDGTLVADPDLMLAGVMDGRQFTMSADRDGQVSYGLSISVWSGASPREPGAALHSFEDQLAEHPGDTAGRHLVTQPEKVLSWPE
jgi:hypothetical protein